MKVPEIKRTKGPRYTPVSKRQARPNAILWLLRNHPELKDAQVIRLIGTTQSTIAQIRDLSLIHIWVCIKDRPSRGRIPSGRRKEGAIRSRSRSGSCATICSAGGGIGSAILTLLCSVRACSTVSSPSATARCTRSQEAVSYTHLDVYKRQQQIQAMRRQLAALEEALSASEAKDKDSQARIHELGSRLNVALAQRVQELARYRSDFFGRLRQVLGTRPDIRVVGDRFVFQSEVFFDAGQAVLKPEGKGELDKLATILLDLGNEMPPDLPWILRVDGHTDNLSLIHI